MSCSVAVLLFLSRGCLLFNSTLSIWPSPLCYQRHIVLLCCLAPE